MKDGYSEMGISKVTVVIPVYNTEKYLDRSVDSVVNQTYNNLEIILVDDGSPDRCPEMCDEWAKKDSRIKVIHKENQGLGMARNTGIENATGEYICFFDSDDYVDLHLIEKALHIAKANKSDIVTYGMVRVNEKGKIVSIGIPQNALEGVSACTRLFSMELINRVSFRFPSERELISEDCYAKFLLEDHIRRADILPEALYYYCRNQQSLSRRFVANRFERSIEFYYKAIELFQKQGKVDEKKPVINDWLIDNTIHSMKQIVNAKEITFQKKKRLLVSIVEDETLRGIVETREVPTDGFKRKLLFNATKRKAITELYLLIWLHLKTSNLQRTW